MATQSWWCFPSDNAHDDQVDDDLWQGAFSVSGESPTNLKRYSPLDNMALSMIYKSLYVIIRFVGRYVGKPYLVTFGMPICCQFWNKLLFATYGNPNAAIFGYF